MSLIVKGDNLETLLLEYVGTACLPVRTALESRTNALNAQSGNISWKIHVWRIAHGWQIKLSAVSQT